MNRSVLLLLFVLVIAGTLCGPTSIAQDFDADSVYYTPLERPVPGADEVRKPRRLFVDTTRSARLVRYYVDINAGVLTGCTNCHGESTISVSTTHGITLGRKLRLGGGIGVDTYYQWVTMPVYGSVSFDLLGTRNIHALYVQGLLGGASARYVPLMYEAPAADVNGGRMYSLMMGYRIPYHKLRLALAAGFRQQSTSLLYETETWYRNERGESVMGDPSRTTVETTLRRVVITFTLSWR